MKKSTSVLIAAWSCLSAGLLYADVTLPAFFSQHMVLQKDAKVPFWGKASPGENVKVTLNEQVQSATADATGKWKVVLDLSKSASGPFEMKVEGNNVINIPDVVVGEVWIASGQSNMEWILKNTKDAESEIASSVNPMLRHFLVTKTAPTQPADDVKGQWVTASPETTGRFTAVGYYFGKKLQGELKVPVGIINTSWGGTPSEAWTSLKTTEATPVLKELYDKTQAQMKAFPDLKKTYHDGLVAWFKDTGREDRMTSDIASYNGATVEPNKGWIEVPKAEVLKGSSKTGVVWYRKEINFVTKPKSITLSTVFSGGLESVYLNGKLVHQAKLGDLTDINQARKTNLNLTGAAIEGINVLAFRMYQPIGAVRMSDPQLNVNGTARPFEGIWKKKPEMELFAPSSDKVATLPKPVAYTTGPRGATLLFNGMIHPLLPYAMRGAIWYQGEANSGRAYDYRVAFPAMITDWREHWGRGEFPFYFCQLANYMSKSTEPKDSNWAELREAQSMTLKLANTGQAVLIDIGEANDIHPRNKKDVGERLARIALAKDYGKAVVYSGPVYSGVKFENGKAIVSFKHTEGGLVANPVPDTQILDFSKNLVAPLVRNSPTSQLEGFAICGEDKNWVWADAKIEGETVLVWSSTVATPVAVRYGWASNPTCNLYNGSELPASPFRTDNYPEITRSSK